MPIAPGDAVQVRFKGLCFGQQIILVLGYRCTVGNAGLTTRAILNDIAQQVAAGGVVDIETPYRACLPPQYSLDAIETQIVSPTRSAAFGGSGLASPGTNANAATVSCDAASVVRRTMLAGRRQVSTLKVGPMPDGASVAGLITNAQKILLAAFASTTLTTIISPVTTVQLVPTILRRDLLPDGRDLTNFYVGATSRVNRRRVVGNGR